MRYWVSWWSGNYTDEGCTNPPFKFWVIGRRARINEGMSSRTYDKYLRIVDIDEADAYLDLHYKDDCAICAVIDAENEDAVWQLVSKHYPDYQQRFCDETEADFVLES